MPTIPATKRFEVVHPPGAARLARIVVWAAICGSAAGCGSTRDAATASLARALDRLDPPRRFAARLSIAQDFRSCFDTAGVEDSATASRCAGADSMIAASEDVTALAAQAAREVERTASGPALHVAALLDLVWSDASGKSLDRSISYLQQAARSADRPEQVLTDLAAAHLVRADRFRTLRDNVEALDAADRARAADSSYAPAVFDAALALERLGLSERAAMTWKRYLQLDARSPWSAEARQRLRRFTTASSLTSAKASIDRAPAAVRELAIDAPQAAVDRALGDLLSQWGRATVAGDSARAESYLRRATLLGGTLAAAHGDSTIAEATRAIERCTSASDLRELAAAHRDFGDALEAYRATNYQIATSAFAAAAARARHSPPLARWAETYHGISLLYEGRSDEGRRSLDSVLARVDAERAPLLVGRVRWSLATYLLRAGRYEESLREAQSARASLVRAGERDGAGAVETLITDIDFALGDEEAGYHSAYEALHHLRAPAGSVSRHNLLFSLTKHALREGLAASALEFADADVASASASRAAISHVEALLSRAQVRFTAGDVARARADIDSARHQVDAWPAGEPQSWFRTSVGELDAQLLIAHNPHRAEELFDSVVVFFDHRRNALRLVPALLEHADATMRGGNASMAAADLGRAASVFDAERARLEQLQHQQSAVESGHRVYDALVMRSLAANRPGEALALLERSRLLLSRRSPVTRGETTLRNSSTTGIELLLVGDTLLTWTVSHGDTAVDRRTVDHVRLLGELQWLHSALAMRFAESETRTLLVSVYDLLLRPIRKRLPPGGSLVVVADGDLADVPYAALIDTSTNRYVVESYAIRFADRLSDTAPAAAARGTASARAVLIGDPLLASSADSDLARLPGASAEASTIGALYSGATVLEGAAASRERVEHALSTATVVHYAGHAVFDDAAPEQSYLTIAPDERTSSGRLTALELSALDLHRARLVVLSGCETLGTRPGRSGGFAGFASAILSAGARGVVGSMWQIDDQLTEPLMLALHRAYRRGGDASAALREAQLTMLRSTNPAQRSPSAWAAFRYVGT